MGKDPVLGVFEAFEWVSRCIAGQTGRVSFSQSTRTRPFSYKTHESYAIGRTGDHSLADFLDQIKDDRRLSFFF